MYFIYNIYIYIMSKTIVLTGGCGFIGHHFAEFVMKNTDWNIIIIDKLTYASMGLDRLRNNGLFNSSRVKIFTIDLCNELSEGIKKEIGTNVNYIVHMAAETHVDNSIKEPVKIISNNINSTVNLLEWARTLEDLEIFFYFSTDEVFGPALGDTLYKEWDRHRPTNPYSASKSAAENICLSYENTYKIPLMIVNVMNAFGERQHVEKFIPLCIKKILNDETIYIHSYPDKKTSGTRFYIHAQNIASAVLFLINNGTIGEKYNIAGEEEVSNLDLAKMTAKFIGKELKFEMVDFHSTRPGHDLRYGLDGNKIYDLGWNPKFNFEKSLEKTVKWTLDNLDWLNE
jgi:dTDP-glucose 4,6-dehydratase